MSRNTPGGDWCGYIKSRAPKNRTSKKGRCPSFFFLNQLALLFLKSGIFWCSPFFEGRKFSFFLKESFLLRSFFAVHVFFLSVFFSLSFDKKKKALFFALEFFLFGPCFYIAYVVETYELLSGFFLIRSLLMLLIFKKFENLNQKFIN